MAVAASVALPSPSSISLSLSGGFDSEIRALNLSPEGTVSRVFDVWIKGGGDGVLLYLKTWVRGSGICEQLRILVRQTKQPPPITYFPK
jgi:hypothetical protein